MNPETRKIYNKRYYEKNKDKISQLHKLRHNKIVIECECGRTYTKPHKLRHFESNIHKKLMA